MSQADAGGEQTLLTRNEITQQPLKHKRPTSESERRHETRSRGNILESRKWECKRNTMLPHLIKEFVVELPAGECIRFPSRRIYTN
jgi:hypothetical protein